MIIYFIFGLQVSSYSQWGHIEWLSLVALGLGIMQFYALKTGTNIESIRDEVVAAEKVRDIEKSWRYGGVFGNPNTLAAFILCCLPFSVRGLIESKNILLVFLYIITVVISLFSVLTTGSRTGLILFVPVFFISYIYISLQRNTEGYSASLNYLKIGMGGVLVTFIYYLYPVDFDMQLIENTFERYNEKGTEEDIRFELWKCTIEKALPFHPGGMGLGYEQFAQFVANECNFKESLGNPHNIFLEVLVNLGIIGGGVFMIMVFTLFSSSQSRKIMRKKRSAEFMFILFFLLYGMSEPLLFSAQKINWVFAIVLGVFFSRNKLQV
jgi:O-antigen ligase